MSIFPTLRPTESSIPTFVTFALAARSRKRDLPYLQRVAVSDAMMFVAKNRFYRMSRVEYSDGAVERPWGWKDRDQFEWLQKYSTPLPDVTIVHDPRIPLEVLLELYPPHKP